MFIDVSTYTVEFSHFEIVLLYAIAYTLFTESEFCKILCLTTNFLQKFYFILLLEDA